MGSQGFEAVEGCIEDLAAQLEPQPLDHVLTQESEEEDGSDSGERHENETGQEGESQRAQAVFLGFQRHVDQRQEPHGERAAQPADGHGDHQQPPDLPGLLHQESKEPHPRSDLSGDDGRAPGLALTPLGAMSRARSRWLREPV